MVRLLIRWAIMAAAVAAAAWLLPGITVEGNGVVVVLVMALVLGFVNAIVRPILSLLSCPLVALTLGLFLFVINAFCFWLAGWLSSLLFDGGFVIDGILPALLGSIIVSVVATLLTMFVPDKKD